MKTGVLDRTPDGRHLFTIVVGDWSDDGHCQKDTFILVSNVPRERFLECLEQTEQKIGLRVQYLHVGYEVSEPTEAERAILERENLIPDHDDEEGFLPPYLVALVVSMVKRADPSIEVELLEIPLGLRDLGYGLYR
jgi:hypothetical protein